MQTDLRTAAQPGKNVIPYRISTCSVRKPHSAEPLKCQILRLNRAPSQPQTASRYSKKYNAPTMNLKDRNPLDGQPRPKDRDINNISKKAEYQSFNNPFQLRLLTLSTHRSRDASTDKAGQKYKKRNKCL